MNFQWREKFNFCSFLMEKMIVIKNLIEKKVKCQSSSYEVLMAKSDETELLFFCFTVICKILLT